MIRALLLRLLGFAPVWEVRSVSMKSGKDIPGERKFKGGYTGARRYFKEHPAPPDHELRLQALLVTKSRYFPTIDDSPLEVPRETEHDIDASNRRQSEFFRKHQDDPQVDGPGPGDEDYDPYDDLQASGGLPEAQALRDTAVPGIDSDHECDSDGPLGWDDTAGAYVPTCSECAKLN